MGYLIQLPILIYKTYGSIIKYGTNNMLASDGVVGQQEDFGIIC